MFIQIIKSSLLLVGLLFASSMSFAQSKPHIFIINTDDLGWGDLSINGHPRIQTPHIDSFAMHSRRLKFYAGAPNCSPSRAALLTGRFPTSMGIINTTKSIDDDLVVQDNYELKTNDITIAQVLKDNGYSTMHTGKWHVTQEYSQATAKSFGFEKSDVYLNSPGWFVFGKTKEFILSSLATSPQKPIFSYIAPNEAHHPIVSKIIAPYDTFVYKYGYDTITTDVACHIGLNGYAENVAEHGENIKYYYAAVSSLDYAFGDFLDFLDSLGIRDSSIILFTSDNGPDETIQCWGSSGCQYSANKRFLFEGGICVPGFIQWPGHWEDGDTVNTPTGMVDILPTLAAVTGASLYNTGQLDGENVTSIWSKSEFERKKAMHWSFFATPRRDYNVYAGAPFFFGQTAYLSKSGQYKMMLNYECMPDSSTISMIDFIRRLSHSQNFKETMLFDIWNDPSEFNDIKLTSPAIYHSLMQEFLAEDKKIRRKAPPYKAEDRRFQNRVICDACNIQNPIVHCPDTTIVLTQAFIPKVTKLILVDHCEGYLLDTIQFPKLGPYANIADLNHIEVQVLGADAQWGFCKIPVTVQGAFLNLQLSNLEHHTRCDSLTGRIEVSAQNGLASNTYIWSNGQNQSTLVNVMPGIYTVTVTSANGATNSLVTTINDLTYAPYLTIYPNEVSLSCQNPVQEIVVVSSGTLLWSNGDTTNNLLINSSNFIPAYAITATGSNGCILSDTIPIAFVENVIENFQIQPSCEPLALQLNWQSYGATSYQLKISKLDVDSTTIVDTIIADGSFVLTDITPFTTYIFEITAYCDLDSSFRFDSTYYFVTGECIQLFDSSFVYIHATDTSDENTCNKAPNVFPNPTDTWLVISVLNCWPPGKISLYDATGKWINEYTITEQNSLISIPTLPKGAYFLHFYNGKKHKIHPILIK